MAIYIEVKKVVEDIDWITYKYCSNYTDWGEFTLKKDDLNDIHAVQLAKNDLTNKYLLRAFSAVRRDFKANKFFPDATCYAA